MWRELPSDWSMAEAGWSRPLGLLLPWRWGMSLGGHYLE